MTVHGAEEIREHVRVYVTVFAALAALTVITVAVSYLDLDTPTAIVVALLVATVKGSLVAMYFMHLVSEKKAVMWLLGLTAVFFLACLYIPNMWDYTSITVPGIWDTLGEGGTQGGHH